MLTRFVRIQLAVFTVASVVGVLALALVYLQVPTLLGIGRITVTLKLPQTGGLYRFSNVTYRGVNVGKVTAVDVTAAGADATLSLDTSPKIPSDLQAVVRSMSALGEQYVDLQPRTDSGPYLRDGAVITVGDSGIPQPVGPMLDQVSALVDSIPRDHIGSLLDETFKGLNGARYDLGSLIDSSHTIAHDLNGVADPARRLVDDSTPLLDGQLTSADAIRTWAHSLAGVTGQFVADDTQVRTILQTGPGAINELSRLLGQLKPTLPMLLANLTSVGQVALTYNASLEQLLVLLPPAVSSSASFGLAPKINGDMSVGDFAIGIADPPPCTVGFLPPSSWRSAADTSDIDTPDGLYCKLPQDSPLAVRGARNYPCMGHPGKRAPTVKLCDSDQPYEPLAMRQHVVGPYPVDPNLIAQGIPPDGRVSPDGNIYAPTEGTPMPAGPPPAQPPPTGQPQPSAVAPDEPGASQIPVAPSAFIPGSVTPNATLQQATYDPFNGSYVGPDGRVYQQSDVVATGNAKTWKDMLPT